jgi:integrase/recombinase XerD
MELASMRAAIDRFLQHLTEERESAKNTVLAYSTDIHQFEQVLAAGAGRPIAPQELTPQMVVDYGVWLERQGYRPSTVSRKMAAARTFLQYLEAIEVQIHPGLHHQLQPPSPPRRLPLTLSEEEVRRLLKAPTKAGTPRGLRDAAILALLYSAGLRASEAVQVDLQDLDLEAGTLQRNGDEPTTLKLGGAKRALSDYLSGGRPHLARDDQEAALFLNLRGKRLSRQGLWLVVKRWAAASNLAVEISPHSLRHSLIHHLLMQGKSKREIQDLLGLSSPNAIRVRLAPQEDE